MARIGPYGVASAAFSASHYQGATGYQSYLAYETKILGLNISASSQMTFGAYDDLASVTARIQQDTLAKNAFDVTSFADLASSVANAATTSLYTTARAPKALNRISVGAPLPFVKRASVSASFIQSTTAAGVRSNIASATLSVGVGTSSVFRHGLHDVERRKKYRLHGRALHAVRRLGTVSTSASGGSGGTRVNLDAVKPLDRQAGELWMAGSRQRAGRRPALGGGVLPLALFQNSRWREPGPQRGYRHRRKSKARLPPWEGASSSATGSTTLSP